jgi:hypothetical protein
MKFKALQSAMLSLLFVLIFLFTAQQPQAGSAAARDHLTPQEADLVRDAQELDKRTAVFIKAAERRLLAINDPNAAKQMQKDVEKWGELKGTRADFLYDIYKILDEAITNVEDVGARDERNPLIPKSIRKLAEASTRMIQQLAPLRDKVTEDRERNSLERAIENAEAIVAAADKLPAAKSKKKDGDKQ